MVLEGSIIIIIIGGWALAGVGLGSLAQNYFLQAPLLNSCIINQELRWDNGVIWVA